MGKASKWFRELLGLKPSATSSPPSKSLKQPKRRWSFGKLHRDQSTAHRQSPGDSFTGEVEVDLNKHAIAVAAATAAVADAAVKTAQAAAAVVILTSNSRSTASSRGFAGSFGIREKLAAVKIQSNFRAYLARRALRALKGLVKLQALVRGHIVRKQTTDMLRRMQALLRAQTRARSMRSESSSKSSSHFHSRYLGPVTPEKIEHPLQAKSTKNFTIKRNGSKSYGHIDDEKILDIDSGKNVTQKLKSLFHHEFTTDQNSQSLTTSKDSTIHQTIHSQSSYEVQSYVAPNDDEATSFCTVENSPIFHSASSRAGSSICGDRPSYMALTESSIAKVRSFSAPRQRPRQLDRFSTGKINLNVYGFFDSRSSGQRAYPGSGRVDRSGIPASGGGGSGGDVVEISMMYLNRY